MEIVIKPLSKETAADFFDFFDHRAFADGSPEGPCYCTRYQMTAQEEAAAFAAAGNPVFRSQEFIDMLKSIAAKQIEDGKLNGYLAYADNMAIGWCNVNDKSNFPKRSANGARYYAEPEKREKVVACFEIAPEYRGKGVATALLDYAVKDAFRVGYRAVEGYPVKRKEHYEWDFQGPFRLYAKSGFCVKKRLFKSFMRKESK